MPRGRRWSRDELILAMNLYCRLPFGQLHQRNPLVVRVAEKLGRTPGSVAMKLCNLASLDPAHQERGVRGLPNASAADRAIWKEFAADWEGMAVDSEGSMASLLGAGCAGDLSERATVGPRAPEEAWEEELQLPRGPTEAESLTRARRGQQFFRRTVLASYSYHCALTGNPVPDLLTASHILPWAQFPKQRVNPRNGICLAAHFDRAFDRGLISFDAGLRLMVSPRIREHLPNEALEQEFVRREGCSLRLPDRFRPEARFIAYHRNTVFL